MCLLSAGALRRLRGFKRPLQSIKLRDFRSNPRCRLAIIPLDIDGCRPCAAPPQAHLRMPRIS